MNVTGHTHLDEFEISYSDYSQRSSDNAVAVSYIAPSMTPTSGQPAFRVYDIDPVTFGVLDITTYIANMSDPGFQSAEGPVWTKYYSAREAYGALIKPPLNPLGSNSKEETRELDPAFWHEVTEAFEKNSAPFEEFMARKRRGWQPEECEGDCRTAEICKLRAGRAQDNCIPPGSIHLGHGILEDNPGSKLGDEECGGSVLADTLSTLAVDPAMRDWLEMLVHDETLT
jgi:sphingomyelin phosphodiesterase